MNVVRVLIVLVLHFAYCATLPESGSVQLDGAADDEPLLLTPLIDAGHAEDAKLRAQVSPAFSYNIRSYAGYLTVDRTAKSHLYFWFFPCTDANRTTSAPLILWLQGGPGTTSLYGLFAENGPFEVTNDGQMRKRDHAWTNRYHMLYIDQPVGTGFSFTDSDSADVGYSSTQEALAEHLHEALVQFYKLFADLADRDLYIAGESYAGKYIPALGYKIYTVNNATTNGSRIPLKGMMIGNGYADPENMLEYGEYLYGLGIIDEKSLLYMKRIQYDIQRMIRVPEWYEANMARERLLAAVVEALNSSSIYDHTSDNFNFEFPFVDFVSKNGTRRSIHAGLNRTFAFLNEDVYERFEGDRLKTVRPWVEVLLEHYPMLFYHGRNDIMVTHAMTEKFLSALRWSGANEYKHARKERWLENKVLAGWYRKAGNLNYVLVRKAGHMVPRDQPVIALKLIDMFVEKRMPATPL